MLSKIRLSGVDTRLGEYGLELPAPVFRAATFSRTVAQAYEGVKTYSREEMIAAIEAEHGAFAESVDTKRLGFWRAVISNSSLDSYFTRMAKSSLMNYAANAGSPSVAFQNSHRHMELPVGRSVAGQFIETGTLPANARAEDFFPAVIADFYSHRDLQLGEVSVEQFLLGVDTHVIMDVSIGFKEGVGFRYTCSICQGDYWSWDCRHIAGVEYAAGDPSGGDPTDSAPEMKLCFIWVENAELSEVSAVYDGATKNAMMIKAEREVRAGRLDSDTEKFLEKRYRFRAEKEVQITGAGAKSRKPETENEGGEQPENQQENEVTTMTEQEIRAAAAKEFADKLRAFAKGLDLQNVAEDASPEAVFEAIRADLGTNKAKAVKYDAARKAEVEIALGQKIRAEGGTEVFTEEKQTSVRSMLENCDVPAIKEFASEWTAQGDVRFGKGRTSKDETDPPEGEGDKGDQTRGKGDEGDRDFNRVNVAEFAGAV